MNIKTLINFLFIVTIAVFVGCKKKINNKLSENYYNLALSYLEGEGATSMRCKQALYSIEKAIESYPKKQYYALKATLLLKLGYTELAEDCFARALKGKLDPRIRADVLNNYACLLSQTGRIYEANSIWEDLKRNRYYLTPEVALFNQAKLLVSKGHFHVAKKRLFEAIEMVPDYVEAHYYLAFIAKDYLKDYELANREVHKVMILEPGHERGQELLKLLSMSR